VLWKRIVFLRDSSTVAPYQQLAELLTDLQHEKDCSDFTDSTHALLLQRLGWLCFIQKDFTRAIEYSRRSVEMVSKHPGKATINPHHVIKTYFNLNVFYDSLKRPNLQIEAIDSCISNAIRLKSGYEWAVPLIYNRTHTLFESGDYYKCISYASIGENISRENGYQNEYILLYLTWRINSLIFLKRFDEADKLLQKAIKEANETHNVRYLGTFYGLKASVAEENKNVKDAITFTKQALVYFEKIKHNDGSAATLNNLGFKLYFQKLHDYGKALSYCNEALKFASPAFELDIFDNIARVYVGKGDYDSALIHFQKAFDIIAPGADERVVLEKFRNGEVANGTAESIFDLVLGKADALHYKYRAFRQEDDLQKAILAYRSADKLLNEIKTDQSFLQSKLFWRREAQHLYENAITASYNQKNADEAFYFFEKSRATLLQDQLNQLGKISDKDVLVFAQLKKRILQLEREQDTIASSSSRKKEIQSDLFSINETLEKLEKNIKKENPLYYQSFLDTSANSIADVSKMILKDHQALLELFEGDSAVFTLLITPSNIHFDKIDKDDFDNTTNAYTHYISNISLINEKYGDYLKTASHLYNLIFKENNIPKGRIIVSPYGHYFPFESLVTSNASTPIYFVNDHAVSYTYSALYLTYDLAKNKSITAQSFLGVAPVQFESGLSLSSLIGSDVSLEQIGANFNDPKILIAGQATRDQFLKNYSNYKIIQLYTHAADSSNTGEPVIHFADSSLYLSDLIAETKPLTKLIVLSACETGNGKLYQGEGVFSFNRAFAVLGIPSSIINLWSVDNIATYKLTELFYEYLSQGLPIDIALQKAKLKFISSSRSNELPYYWAATIVAGKSDSLGKKRISPWTDVAIVLIVISGLAYFGGKKRRRKN